MDVIKLMKNTLTFEELKEMLGPLNSKSVRFLPYDQIPSYKTMKDLFTQGFTAAIILLDQEQYKNHKSGHFILVMDYPDHVEHFDSYGLSVDEELKLTQEPHLTKFFNDSEKAMIQNNTELQKFGGSINTCGRWCVARLLLRDLKLNQFEHFIHQLGTKKDLAVTVLTALLPYKR